MLVPALGQTSARFTAATRTAASTFTGGITQRHAAYWAGDGSLGQGGVVDVVAQHSAQVVDGTTTFASLDSRAKRTCGVDTSGGLWCWGIDENGFLGTGTTDPQPAPARVQGTPSGSTWSAVSVGELHACALRSDSGHVGELWCWGAGGNGQLGNGAGDSVTPVRVAGTATWSSVSAAQASTCAVRSDTSHTGEAWCWGNNTAGSWVPAAARRRAASPSRSAQRG